jgi:hypothetical protein
MGSAPQGGSAGRVASGETGEAQKLARVVFAVLVVACFVAFVLTQRLKHTPTAVQSFEADEAFYPAEAGRHAPVARIPGSASAPAASCRGRVPLSRVNATKRIEYLSFKPAQAEAVTVEILNAAEQSVATVVRGLPAERYKQLSLCWNGQRGPTESGGLAPPGTYRVQVKLLSANRTVKSPDTFKLERRP